MSPTTLIQHLAESLVDRPSAVEVRELDGSPSKIIELRVDPADLGKVIGRRGHTARALRSVLAAACLRGGRRFVLNIADE
jgi:predicted RNA-binding protein YlqC (UPF0109 family)